MKSRHGEVTKIEDLKGWGFRMSTKYHNPDAVTDEKVWQSGDDSQNRPFEELLVEYYENQRIERRSGKGNNLRRKRRNRHSSRPNRQQAA